MPNILLTTYCNRRCPYCFALDAMEEAQAKELTMRELITYADMIVASGNLNTGVLGGEPTLHPQFCEMIGYLLARNIRLNIFTNGICSDELMDRMDTLPKRDRFRFVVNVNPPDIEPEPNQKHQEKFIRRFARQCHLGFNIYRPDIDPRFLSDLARRTGLKSGRIRVGLAQPIVGEKNAFLNLDYYRQVAEQVVCLAEAVFDLDIKVGLDCGFPLCAFSDEQLGRLRRTLAHTKFVCGIAADVGPQSKAWGCFPLAKQTRMTIDKSTSLAELRRHFINMNKEYRNGPRRGIFPQCNDCIYMEHHACDGGCVAHLIPSDNR